MYVANLKNELKCLNTKKYKGKIRKGKEREKEKKEKGKKRSKWSDKICNRLQKVKLKQ